MTKLHRLLALMRKGNTLRLALSYLAIIMVLSVSFSVIFYRTSSTGLHLQFTSTPMSEPRRVLILDSTEPPQTNNDAMLASINSQLQRSIHDIRTQLLQRLIMINTGVMVVGVLFSFYLARKTLEPIEAAMEAQSRFSSDASHELRTPITALRVRNEVALYNPNLALDDAKKIIQDSIDQAIRLEQISEGLLRLSQNDQSLAKSPVKIKEAANEAVLQLQQAAQVKHITVHQVMPGTIVMADAQSLVQVLTILIDNAIKYSPEDSVIDVEAGTEGRYGVIHVRDHGPGISNADLPHIFDRFYRADYARAKHGKRGYGLGLAIAQKIIEQNNGKLTVASTVGKGSTFTVRLPLAA